MTWHVVARKDFADARRSKTLWILSAVFLLLAVGVAVLYSVVPEFSSGDLSTIGLIGFLSAPVTMFVYLTALVTSYKSVAGETESGSSKLLLGLPHTRRDVVVGKVVGRSLVVAVPVVVGLVAMLAVVFWFGVTFSPLKYLAFALGTLYFVGVYVAVYVGLSASTTSTSRASTLCVFTMILAEFAWDVVPLGAWFVASGFQLPEGFASGNLAAMPDWVAFLNTLPPSGAYQSVVGGVQSGSMGSGAEPFFLQDWFGVVILAAWAAIPLAFGYYRYRAADL